MKTLHFHKTIAVFAITMACLTTARAAISVGPGGSGIITFDVTPTPTDGWTRLTNMGGSADIGDAATFLARVNTNIASQINQSLPTTATVNPSISSQNMFRHNTVNLNVQSVPTGVGYTTLLATLQNDSGSVQNAITVTYDLGELHAAGTTVVEELPGFYVYYSLSGDAGSWTEAPALSNPGSPGGVTTVSGVINLGTWNVGSPLYIIWADDNAAADRNNANNEEGGYTLDNVSFVPGGTVQTFITVTSPTNGQAFPQGAPITVNASAVMANPITNVAFFHDSILIGDDTTSPYSVVYSNATLGTHTLTATATDNTGATVSSTNFVQITINPNNPPSVTITNPTVTSFLVGANITNGVVATDSDGTIARVEFYLDDVLTYTDATSGFKYEYDDALVGAHTVLAVAVDNGGARGSNSLSFTITNPPNVTLILTNGSTWKYLDDTNDPGPTWRQFAFDDSGWSNGVAEIGFGDSAQDRPERTMARRVVSGYTNITFYFRHAVNAANPAAFSQLVLNIKQDDGSVVYFNDVEVYRSSNMPAGTPNHATFATATLPDDGAGYYTTNLPTSVLAAGQNIIAVEMHQDAFGSSDISFDLMLWGVNPAGPQLRITRISDTQADISWAIDGNTYILEFKTDLNSTTWTGETGIDTPSGGFHHVTVSTVGGNKFWRLRSP